MKEINKIENEQQGNKEMTKITKVENQVPEGENAMNPHTLYGVAIATQTAPFLKFVKGEFLHGTDGEKLPLGTKLVPNMEELKVGFIKWHDGEPIDENMRRVIDGIRPTREECGDTDKGLWPKDPNGNTVDPWQLHNTLPMRDPEMGQEFIFTTSSKGGINAIGKLSSRYGHQRGNHEGQLPLIKLDARPYRHKLYGEVHIPVFKIVGWQSEAELIAGKSDETAPIDDDIPF